MSYMRAPQTNGNNNHLNSNGYGRLGRFDFDITPDTSADERSQSRGPHTATGPGAVSSQQYHGPSRVDRQHAQRRSRDFDFSRSRSRPAVGRSYGPAGSQVEEILRYIEQQWSFMASDSCIPVKVALQLMDPSSLGLAEQYDSFRDVHQQLQNALKVIVNEHHQGFNSSIGTFHKIQAAIHSSQQRVRQLRAGLVQAKGSLSAPRPELRAFAQSSQSYDQMLQVLDEIERLQAVPELLEAQISEKRFLGAVATLQEALALIRKPEMEDIGALSDLMVYLSNQEHSLTDILIEELHSHLYLKSPYCEERWKAHSKRDVGTEPTIADGERGMHSFLDSYNGTTAMVEDTTRNPEANTFYYIQLLVESLNRLAKLDVAVDQIEQRMPVELFKVVERSHGEVEQRHPSAMRSVAARNRQHMLGDLSRGADTERNSTLQDLLTTLYAKFEAIAEGHRVLHDVTGAILRRETQSDTANLNRSFRELWKLLQSEIRSLLHDHLASSGSSSGQRLKDSDPSANIFKPQPRDRNRRLFKLADTDHKSTDLATEREDLEFILKASVPGLVNTSQTQKSALTNSTNASALPDRSATGHKLLVEPSVFNMSVLLTPSLHFLSRLQAIVPPHSGVPASSLTSFLDDFLINVFYPQLDETLLELCTRCLNDAEAFQPDPDWNKYSQRPIFKGTVRFYQIIERVCELLDGLPHEQSFTLLVVGQLRAYYDRCYQWSKSLLQRAMAAQSDSDDGLKMRLAADLATSGEINDVVIQLLTTPANTTTGASNPEEHAVLAEKEAQLLINRVKARRLEEADLISDRKTLAALCTLHVSARWLVARCKHLRFLSPRAVDIANTSTTSSTSHRHPHHLNLATSWEPNDPYLPLSPDSAQLYDAVLLSLSELSNLLLRTLHLDLRLQLLHAIYAALDTSYALTAPSSDPSPEILALSTTLSSYAEVLSTALLPASTKFLTANLHVLVNAALIAFVSAVQALDPHGYGLGRIQVNILVLQQSLKNLEGNGGVSLERAAAFWEMAERGPEVVVARGGFEGFGTGELKSLVRLCYEEGRDGPGGVEGFVGRLG